MPVDERVYAAALLLSWCGPFVSEACVVKDSAGYAIYDANGQIQSAQQSHLRELLGLPSERRDMISRSFLRLKAGGYLIVEADKSFYPAMRPVKMPIEEEAEAAPGVEKFFGDEYQLPMDPEGFQVAREIATGMVEELKTRMRELRRKMIAEYRDQLRARAAELNMRRLEVDKSADGENGKSVNSGGTKVDESVDGVEKTVDRLRNGALPNLPTSGAAIKEEKTEETFNKKDREVVVGRSSLVESSNSAGNDDDDVLLSDKSKSPEPTPGVPEGIGVVIPAFVAEFRQACLEVLRDRGLATPPNDAWWVDLFEQIDNSGGSHEHYRARLQTLSYKVTHWTFLRLLVKDVEGGKEQWERDHPPGKLSEKEEQRRAREEVDALAREFYRTARR